MHHYIQLISHMGSDKKVVEDARMSIQGEGVRKNTGPDSKLIDYLMRNKHTTPFEGSTATFEVQTPIFVARQWMRHRTASYNEMSARYGQVPQIWFQPDEWRGQAESNKQCSSGPLEEAVQLRCHEVYSMTCSMAYKAYEALLDNGVSREQARMVLPQSMYTKFRVTANLWGFMHFMALRNHPHAQHEIREYAQEMEHLLEAYWPLSIAAWRKYVKQI